MDSRLREYNKMVAHRRLDYVIGDSTNYRSRRVQSAGDSLADGNRFGWAIRIKANVKIAATGQRIHLRLYKLLVCV
jgi:hypothetical protein